MSPQEWMDRNGRSVASIAKEIGVAVSTVSRPVSGERYPTFQLMLEFYQMSGTLVSFGDWAKLFDGRYRRGEGVPRPRKIAKVKGKRPVGRPRRQAVKRAERRGEQDGKEAT